MRRFLTKKNRALVSELVRTDFKLRYQGSVLGYAWSLLRPLLMFVILYVVFVYFLKVGSGIPHYPQYLLFGVVVWNFFAEMTTQSLGSVVGRSELISKIKIPRWIIVLSSSFASTINLCLNLLVLAVFLIFAHIHLSGNLAYLPLLFVELYIFALGLSFFLSAAFVKYRDINYIWEVIMQAGFYLSAVLFPLQRVNKLVFKKLILLNPIAQVIQDARYILITNKSIIPKTVFNNGWYEYIPIVIVVIVFIIGAAYFKSESKYFAENI